MAHVTTNEAASVVAGSYAYLRVRDLELLLGGEAEEHLNELDVGFLEGASSRESLRPRLACGGRLNAYLEHHHPESENLDAQVLTLPLSPEFA